MTPLIAVAQVANREFPAAAVASDLDRRTAAASRVCDFIRGWLCGMIQAHGQLAWLAPEWFENISSSVPDSIGERKLILDKVSEVAQY